MRSPGHGVSGEVETRLDDHTLSLSACLSVCMDRGMERAYSVHVRPQLRYDEDEQHHSDLKTIQHHSASVIEPVHQSVTSGHYLLDATGPRAICDPDIVSSEVRVPDMATWCLRWYGLCVNSILSYVTMGKLFPVYETYTLKFFLFQFIYLLCPSATTCMN